MNLRPLKGLPLLGCKYGSRLDEPQAEEIHEVGRVGQPSGLNYGETQGERREFGKEALDGLGCRPGGRRVSRDAAIRVPAMRGELDRFHVDKWAGLEDVE